VSVVCGLSITFNWGSFVDNKDGTIKFIGVDGIFGRNTYTAKTLYFMKCSFGQVYNSTNDDCTGTGLPTLYGATKIQYCSVNDESCNNETTKLLNGSGESATYGACNDFNSSGIYGKKNWRVPTKEELKILINCIDKTMPLDLNWCENGNYISPTINRFFPNTLNNYYWSSSTNADNTTNAWLVNFFTSSTFYASKTSKLYVRCVSE
jgi:hypothetical protein